MSSRWPRVDADDASLPKATSCNADGIAHAGGWSGGCDKTTALPGDEARRIAAQPSRSCWRLIRQRRAQPFKLVERRFPPRLACRGDGRL
jgi:hypothetical protein